jgi:hypothetical protein
MGTSSTNNIRLGFILCLLTFLVSCSSARLDSIASEPINAIASDANLTNSFVVGNITGATNIITKPYNEPSNDDFKDALQRTLTAQGLIATQDHPPRYVVNAAVAYETPTFVNPADETTINLGVIYDITAAETHETIWRETIHTMASAPLMNDGSIWKTILSTSQKDIRTRLNLTTDKATKDNLKQFCERLPTVLPTK